MTLEQALNTIESLPASGISTDIYVSARMIVLLCLLCLVFLAGCCSEAKPLVIDDIERRCEARGLDCDIEYKYSGVKREKEIISVYVWRGGYFNREIIASLHPSTNKGAELMLDGVAASMREGEKK